MSGNEFVLVYAGRSYKASARLVFRDLGKKHGLRDDLINTIHEHYMVLVHLDESARSTIRAALLKLQKTWIQELYIKFPTLHDFDPDFLENI